MLLDLANPVAMIKARRLTAQEATAIRQSLGLSQAELAAVFEMSPENGDRAIRRWEADGPPIAAGLALLWLQQQHEKKGG